MNTRSEAARTSTPVSSLTAGELTAAGKSALQRIAAEPLRRIKGGWYAPGHKVSLKVADQLKARGLARVENNQGRMRLVATGSGRMLADVIEERSKRS